MPNRITPVPRCCAELTTVRGDGRSDGGRLDRSRSLNTLAAITSKKAGFRSIGDTWADTTTSHGRLMLTVLGGLAEFERDLIRARTGEGRARAVARGPWRAGREWADRPN
jgi:DNA invertase Pin-like site-specific DNA recombinase